MELNVIKMSVEMMELARKYRAQKTVSGIFVGFPAPSVSALLLNAMNIVLNNMEEK